MPTDYNTDLDFKKLREKMASVINDSDKDLERIKTAELQDLASPEDLLTRTITGMADDLRGKSFPKEAEAIKEARAKTAAAKTEEKPVEKKAEAAEASEAVETEEEAPAEKQAEENPFYQPVDFKAAFENPAFVKGFNDYLEAHGPIFKEAALNLMYVPLS